MKDRASSMFDILFYVAYGVHLLDSSWMLNINLCFNCIYNLNSFLLYFRGKITYELPDNKWALQTIDIYSFIFNGAEIMAWSRSSSQGGSIVITAEDSALGVEAVMWLSLTCHQSDCNEVLAQYTLVVCPTWASHLLQSSEEIFWLPAFIRTMASSISCFTAVATFCDCKRKRRRKSGGMTYIRTQFADRRTKWWKRAYLRLMPLWVTPRINETGFSFSSVASRVCGTSPKQGVYSDTHKRTQTQRRQNFLQ